MHRQVLLLSALATLSLSPLAAQTTISNPAPGGSYPGGYAFGPTQFTRVGQLFTAPTADPGSRWSLLDFSFWLGPPYATVTFRARVFEWALGALGTELFSSSHYTTNVTSYSKHTFATGGVTLDAGKEYVALLDASGTGGTAYVGFATGSNTYSGGQLYRASSGGGGTVSYDDAYFEMNFAPAGPEATVTPEPATMALLGTGMAGLAAMRRRRRRPEESIA